MNELNVFTHPSFGSIRTVERSGEPWFVGKDVAEVLGYAKPLNAIAAHVDEDDSLKQGLTDSLGRTQETILINESGLYSLILSSKLPGAKEFKRWVTSEVLPSIRRHGAYMTPETIEAAILNPDTMIRIATQLKQEREARLRLEAEVEQQRPAVLFAAAVEASDRDILIGELAKYLRQNGVQTGQKRLFEQLRKDGFLISRQGADYNLPTQRAMEMGLFRIKETAIAHPDGHVSVSRTPKVTGKGQTYFINRYCAKQ